MFDIFSFALSSKEDQLRILHNATDEVDIREIFRNTQYEDVAKAAIKKMSDKSCNIVTEELKEHCKDDDLSPGCADCDPKCKLKETALCLRKTYNKHLTKKPILPIKLGSKIFQRVEKKR